MNTTGYGWTQRDTGIEDGGESPITALTLPELEELEETGQMVYDECCDEDEEYYLRTTLTFIRAAIAQKKTEEK